MNLEYQWTHVESSSGIKIHFSNMVAIETDTSFISLHERQYTTAEN